MNQLSKISLRPVTNKDLKIIRNWRNQKGIWEFNTQFTLLNMLDQKNWFIKIQSPESNRKMFMIIYSNNKPIGICGLIHLDKQNRSADVATILGNQKFHGKGFGTESLTQLVKYGFSKLRLHRIGAEIFEFNKSSFKLFKKLNFQSEAIKHQSLWRNNQWWDIHVFSLLRKDFDE